MKKNMKLGLRKQAFFDVFFFAFMSVIPYDLNK